MKAVATQLGRVVVTDIEKPAPLSGHVLVRTEYSAISPGTEMSFVRQSADKLVVMGYSAVGIVEQLGESVTGIEVGQRVAVYGAPYTRHAEWLSVPANLAAVVPDHVDPEEAAFAGLGAIAIHALRVADLHFGESAVVVGLGILGNLTAQIANAAAYQTLGMDLNADRAAMLQEHGVTRAYTSQEELNDGVSAVTGGVGADAVLLCASGPGEPIINAALESIRLRGKVVIVGDVTAEFSRGLMFGKEAQVLISRAGGPGRYDSQYERDNIDYPIGYVRWTEGRNIAEYIRLLAEGRISIKKMITNVYGLDQAEQAYANYAKPSKTIGTLFKYGEV